MKKSNLTILHVIGFVLVLTLFISFAGCVKQRKRVYHSDNIHHCGDEVLIPGHIVTPHVHTVTPRPINPPRFRHRWNKPGSPEPHDQAVPVIPIVPPAVVPHSTIGEIETEIQPHINITADIDPHSVTAHEEDNSCESVFAYATIDSPVNY